MKHTPDYKGLYVEELGEAGQVQGLVPELAELVWKYHIMSTMLFLERFLSKPE